MSKSSSAKIEHREVAFSEVSFPVAGQKGLCESTFRPDITTNTGPAVIVISNTTSEALLTKIFEVISNSR